VALALLLLLLAGSVQAGAPAGESILARHVTLQLEAQPVQTALTAIETQLNIHFLYSQQLIGAERKVSLQAVNQPLSEVLQSLLDPLHIKYEVVKSGILLVPIVEFRTAAIPITGRVLDASGQPIPGATVLEQGTTNGTSTDEDGRFSLRVQPGATLVVSAIGLKTQQVTVGERTTFEVRLQASATDLADVVVVGSRGLPRTDVERPSPVDVLNARELQLTGQTDLGQQVQFNSPSFNSAKTGVNGVAKSA
jgi:iron complex outermembrane receptor protein